MGPRLPWGAKTNAAAHTNKRNQFLVIICSCTKYRFVEPHFLEISSNLVEYLNLGTTSTLQIAQGEAGNALSFLVVLKS
jgi:hypothetical protein